MKFPRLSIAALMAVVALVAVDLVSVQAAISLQPHSNFADEVVLGVLPMGNILAMGLLPFRSRAGRKVRRLGLVGFEIFGLAALMSVLTVSAISTETVLESVRQIADFLKIDRPPALPIAVAMGFLIPQVAIGLLGTWLMPNLWIWSEVRSTEVNPVDSAH